MLSSYRVAVKCSYTPVYIKYENIALISSRSMKEIIRSLHAPIVRALLSISYEKLLGTFNVWCSRKPVRRGRLRQAGGSMSYTYDQTQNDHRPDLSPAARLALARKS